MSPDKRLMWDQRYLRLAAGEIASWSKDPSTKVGAVLVSPGNRGASFGYNGFPRGADDSPHLYLDKEYKRTHIIHAEINALDSHGEYAIGCTLYSSFPCCSACVAEAVRRGAVRIVSIPLNTQGRAQEWITKWQTEIAKAKYLAARKEVAYEFVQI